MKAAPKQTNNPASRPATETSQGNWQNQSAQVAINGSPRMVAQRRQIEGYLGTGQPQTSASAHPTSPINQLQSIQRVKKLADEEKQPLQRKFTVQPEQQPVAKANNTGLPDKLKSGIESLSGLAMDNVKVHYNSSQPAQLNALAYAQGTDIHIAPGQEQHLPHEAWHVVQQAQGRVRPTLQAKGVPVNDDKGLEHEADVMGTKAMHMQIEPVGEGSAQRVIKGDSGESRDLKSLSAIQKIKQPIQSKSNASHISHGTQRVAPQKHTFIDNRPTTLLQRKLSLAMTDSPRVIAQRTLSDRIHDSTRMITQRQKMALQHDATIPKESQSNTALPKNLSSAVVGGVIQRRATINGPVAYKKGLDNAVEMSEKRRGDSFMWSSGFAPCVALCAYGENKEGEKKMVFWHVDATQGSGEDVVVEIIHELGEDIKEDTISIAAVQGKDESSQFNEINALRDSPYHIDATAVPHPPQLSPEDDWWDVEVYMHPNETVEYATPKTEDY